MNKQLWPAERVNSWAELRALYYEADSYPTQDLLHDLAILEQDFEPDDCTIQVYRRIVYKRARNADKQLEALLS